LEQEPRARFSRKGKFGSTSVTGGRLIDYDYLAMWRKEDNRFGQFLEKKNQNHRPGEVFDRKRFASHKRDFTVGDDLSANRLVIVDYRMSTDPSESDGGLVGGTY
jgi:hypothetical protein